MRAASIEPTITEMLDDPIVGLLMAHDGVTAEELWRLLEDARYFNLHETGVFLRQPQP